MLTKILIGFNPLPAIMAFVVFEMNFLRLYCKDDCDSESRMALFVCCAVCWNLQTLQQCWNNINSYCTPGMPCRIFPVVNHDS